MSTAIESLIAVSYRNFRSIFESPHYKKKKSGETIVCVIVYFGIPQRTEYHFIIACRLNQL
jgi:hypothetical protein